MTSHRLRSSPPSRTYQRAVALVIGSTLVLTMAFLGGLAFLEQSTQGIQGRVPWYFVATGGIFVSAIFLLETQTNDGRRILFSAVIGALTGFVVMILGVEGLIFAIRNPEKVLVSQLVLYFISAGLLATGFGYWTLNHWREFIDE